MAWANVSASGGKTPEPCACQSLATTAVPHVALAPAANGHRRPGNAGALDASRSRVWRKALTLALWVLLGLLLTPPACLATARAATRAKPASPALATVYGEPIVRAEAEAALGGSHVGHPAALRQAVVALVELRLALRGLRATDRQHLAEQTDLLAAEAAAHQGGMAAWIAQLATLGQSPGGWKCATLTRLAVAAQLPAEATAVAEAEVLERYQRRWGRFVVPAQLRLSEIAVPLSSDATTEVEQARGIVISAHERLERGEPFAEVARTLSQTPDAQRGGDREWVGADVLDVPLRAALETLQPGQRTRPTRSAWGFHILWLRERQPARKLSLAEARPLVVAQLAAERGQVARRNWLNLARARAEKAGHIRWMVPK